MIAKDKKPSRSPVVLHEGRLTVEASEMGALVRLTVWSQETEPESGGVRVTYTTEPDSAEAFAWAIISQVRAARERWGEK